MLGEVMYRKTILCGNLWNTQKILISYKVKVECCMPEMGIMGFGERKQKMMSVVSKYRWIVVEYYGILFHSIIISNFYVFQNNKDIFCILTSLKNNKYV